VSIPVDGTVANPVDVAFGLSPETGEIESSPVLPPQPEAARVKASQRGEGARAIAFI